MRINGFQPTRLRSVMGSTAGAFTLRSLHAGDYLLIAVGEDAADRWKDPAFLAAAVRSATRVTLGWGETKVQDLTLREIK
jgi:hypothetical protein